MLVVLFWALTGSACDDDTPATPSVDVHEVVDAILPEVRDASDALDARDDRGDEGGDVVFIAPISGTYEEIAPTPETGVSPDGASDVSVALGAGAVAAGRVVSAAGLDVFGGIDGRCRLGDFRIYNAQAAFCIEDLTSTSSIVYDGGHLIDAVRLGRGARDGLTFIGPDLDLRETAAYEVAVLADGSDGETAVVRVRAHDSYMRFLYGLLRTDISQFFPAAGHLVVTEYRLAPDSTALEMVTWISHPQVHYRRMAGDLIAVGDTTTSWVAGEGLGTLPARNAAEMIVLASDVSYLYYTGRESDVNGFAADGDAPLFTSFLSVDGVIPAGQVGAYRRWFVVGDGSTYDLDQGRSAATGVVPDTVQVVVEVREEISLAPVPNVAVQLRDESGAVIGLAWTDQDGRSTHFPPAGTYVAHVGSWDGPVIPASAPFTATPAGETVQVVAPAPGRIHLQITAREPDGSVVPMPGRAALSGASSRLFHAKTGAETIIVPPGDYHIEISRGMEYAAFAADITVGTDVAPLEVAAELEHLIPTPGFVAGEFHQHAAPSIDSEVPMTARVLENLADGVDFMSPSDHDNLYDYAKVVDELGVRDGIFALNGCEVSPVWGHFNGIGAEPDAALQGYGAPALAVANGDGTYHPITAGEIVRTLRDSVHARLVQINHPRSGSGFFHSLGFDPELGFDAIDPEDFPRTLDLLEVYNDRSELCDVLRDWYSLHNRGYRLVAVGNSDTHELGNPAGYPRNYVRVPSDDPAQLDVDTLTAAIAGGDVTIAGGAWISLGAGWAVGETRSVTAGAQIAIPVQVHSPPFARVTTLLTIVNGHIVDTRALSSTPDDLIDFDDVITITLERDAYVHFIAWGTERCSAVYAGKIPFSLTNPIYFDVDGDTDNDQDLFEPPGAGEPLDPVDYALCTL